MGSFTFTVELRDGTGRSIARDFTIVVTDLFSLSASSVVASPASAPADNTALITATVTLRDAAGRPVIGQTVAMSPSVSRMTLASSSPTYSPTTDANGVARFPYQSTRAADVVFQATVAGVNLNPSNAVRFTGGTATGLRFIVNPPATTGTSTPFAMSVELYNDYDRVYLNDSATLAIKPDTGTTAAVLGGTTTLAASDGVALFSGLTVSLAGTGYQLVATSGTLTGYSSSFNVVTGGTVAVAAPVITAPVNGLTTNRGTSALPLVISGAAPANASVQIRRGGHYYANPLATVTADSTGAWTYSWTGASGYEDVTLLDVTPSRTRRTPPGRRASSRTRSPSTSIRFRPPSRPRA